ncbi:MAG: cytochrome c [Planctomycetota bacterium]|nr:MAG: cytochrome c [Planctomycetota bacterium]
MPGSGSSRAAAGPRRPPPRRAPPAPPDRLRRRWLGGATLFEETCAGCHGTTGKGDGPSAVASPTKPRDLTAEPYKFVSIEEGTTEVDALVAYLTVGRIESGMPPYGHMHPDELKSLALFIESLRPEPNFTDVGSDGGDG